MVRNATTSKLCQCSKPKATAISLHTYICDMSWYNVQDSHDFWVIASAQITCSCSSTITIARNVAIRALSSWVPGITDHFGAPVFGAPVLLASDFGDSDLGRTQCSATYQFSCIIRNIPSLVPRHHKRIYPAYEPICSKNTGTYTYIQYVSP